MRRLLVTTTGLSLVVMSSCLLKETPTNEAAAGDSSSGGKMGVIIASGGTAGDGGEVDPGQVRAEPCPDLLEQLGANSNNICSQTNVAATFNRINVVIVFDKSGSMNAAPEGYTKSKWSSAVDAMKKSLDPNEQLIDYGLLLYPFSTSSEANACELESGEAAVNVAVGPASETIPLIEELMAATKPGGGTPTASALHAALEYYTRGQGLKLEGRKYVLLVTDGGPNCNAELSCETETCTAYLDRSPDLSSCWNGGIANCCDPSIRFAGGLPPQSLCLDDAAVTNELGAMREAGIHTFVVGIPGSEAYASHLDGFAEAGGEPVTGKPHKYYEVSGESGLAEAFSTITTWLIDSCTVPLEMAPEDLNRINVAIDCSPLPQLTGEKYNWHYDGPSQSIIIEGPKCELIKAVGVERIDVVNGCETILIR